jgi:hypothetical protein
VKPLSSLAISQGHHQQLERHLFPSDGLEAAAILLCVKSAEQRLIVQDIITVPYSDCKIRTPDGISWPGHAIESAIDRAESAELSLLLIHSHPGGLFDFSAVDNDSDLTVMPSLFEASASNDTPHGSAIMVPSGAIRARLYTRALVATNMDYVLCPGDDIQVWRLSKQGGLVVRPMAFSDAMRDDLKYFTVCVVGVSGTGSIVAEQLARLGVGRLILIDFDDVEFKNLNRILNTTLADAENGVLKVDMFAKAVKAYRNDIDIIATPSTVACREAIKQVGNADILFCSVDSFEGRQICDRMAAAFIQPLFDVAVTIPTRTTLDGSVAVGDVCGRVDYVKPGGSTLFDRGVYSPEALRREYLQTVAPEEFDCQVAEGYIKGTLDEAPSVISLNMRAASDCVMEFTARVYPFRQEPNDMRVRTLFSLAAGEVDFSSEDTFDRTENPILGRGLAEPLLAMPCFSKMEKV